VAVTMITLTYLKLKNHNLSLKKHI